MFASHIDVVLYNIDLEMCKMSVGLDGGWSAT